MNDEIEELLTRGVANIIPSKKELEEKLKSGKKLNIYLGIDPTAPKIHLGHTVALRKLRSFAKHNHNVTLVIGDGTALIGDTSDRESERPALTQEIIEENFKNYKKQADLILKDMSDRITVRKNSEWLSGLSYNKILQLSMEFSLNDFIGRELIKKRLTNGKNIGLHEVLYPAMQAYDSLMLDTDIQIGGTDQTFNIQSGRTLIKRWKNKESFVLTTPILEGTDGRKMSKTFGNAIWLEDNPDDIYAKVMSINDDLIITYFTLVTSVPLKEIDEVKKEMEKGQNPMVAKKRLSNEIVSDLYGKDVADSAESNFERTVQKKEFSSEFKTYSINDIKSSGASLATVLTENLGIFTSKSEAKRVIQQGGIVIGDKIIKNPETPLKDLLTEDSTNIIIGKKKFFKIKR